MKIDLTPQEKSFRCPTPESAEVIGSTFHNLHYMEWGDPEAKETVVCIHGMTRNARDFDYIACRLAHEGFRVLSVDIVGRGKSDWLSHGSLYSYPLYVADMIAFFTQKCTDDVYLIGTSMGGLIGIMLEASMPHLIKAMVLNDVGPLVPKEAITRIGSYVGHQMDFQTRFEAEAHFRSVHACFGVREEEHWQHLFRHSIIENKDGTWSYSYDPAIGEAFWTRSGKQRKLPDMDIWSVWNMIDPPALVLRGEESDILLPETAKQMAARKQVDLLEFANVGHAPMLMEDAQIEPVVEWLVAHIGRAEA